jgi:two-component system, NarL family, invasion response regulator UvrY
VPPATIDETLSASRRSTVSRVLDVASGKTMPSVLVIDDLHILRHGLKLIFDDEVRGAVIEGTTSDLLRPLFQSEAIKHRMDAVVIGPNLGNHDRSYILAATRDQHPQAKVLMICAQPDDPQESKADRNCRMISISKTVRCAELIRVFRSLLGTGDPVIPQAAPQRGFEFHRPRLSEREGLVMRALVSGKRNRDIAADLNLSAKTISTFKRRILHKLRLHSTADLVRYVFTAERTALARKGVT